VYAEDKDLSVCKVVKEANEHFIDECDAKEILKEACESGGKLREDSQTCKHEIYFLVLILLKS
jgi:hypothetical protein